MEDPEYGAPSALPGTNPIPRQKRQVKNIQINNTIPTDILENEELNNAIKSLPANYSFEIHKTLWRMRKCNATRVALQFPEGLLMYSCTVSDILETFGKVEVIIMGDVTYGACCIDDLSAIALGCDFMVHYGHSCLIPIDVCQIPTLYVFVDITFNPDHLIMMLIKHLSPHNTHLILAGTIQFSSTIQTVAKIVKSSFLSVTIPQAKPLSQGEVLGCTAPKLLVQKVNTKQNANNTVANGNTIKIHVNTIENEEHFGHGATPDGDILEPLISQENNSCCGTSSSSSASACCNTKKTTEGCCSGNTCKTTTNPDSDDLAQAEIDAMELPVINNDNNNNPEVPIENIVCVFLADGRFHLESLMIQNPHIPRYLRYDPYNRMMTDESYDYETMHTRRYAAIQAAKKSTKWGVILGTLGRQGSTHILERIEKALEKRGLQYTPILLSEVFPTKLSLLRQHCDAWVQIACPRLSVDWASNFDLPLLSPYEFFVTMAELDKEKKQQQEEEQAQAEAASIGIKTEWLPGGVYPMDYYHAQGGEWTNYYHKQPQNITKDKEQEDNTGTNGKKISGKDALAMIRAKNAAKKQQQLEQQKQIDLEQQQKQKELEQTTAPSTTTSPTTQKTQADDMD